MRNRHDRLTKYGIVALAGIAVLGWVREPEKHQSPGPWVSTMSSAAPAGSRTTFYSPFAAPGAVGVDERPADNRGTDSPPAPAPKVIGRIPPSPGEQRTPAVVKTREREPLSVGRHEGPHPLDDEVVTRSRDPRKERSEDPDTLGRAAARAERSQDDPTPTPQADGANDTYAHTPPAVGNKTRSKARSAAIIVGTAVAGAAIGAATGGGKGAAIGALSGGAGGYVYDRMTRYNNTAGTPGALDKGSSSRSDADQETEYRRYDRGASIARRFGTPTFN